MNKFVKSALAMSVVALGMTSCSSDELMEGAKGNLVEVRVSTSINVPTAGTRTALDEVAGNLEWKWTASDRVWATDAQGNFCGYLDVVAVDENNPAYASFDGTVLIPEGQSSLDVNFHYLGNLTEAEGSGLAGKFGVDISGDNVKGDFDELVKYDILGSTDAVKIENNGAFNVIPDFNMDHKCAMGHFAINGIDQEIAYVEVSGANVIANYNLASKDIEDAEMGAIKVYSKDFYIPMLPQQSADLDFKVVDNEGRVYVGKMKKGNGDNVVFDVKAGEFYRYAHKVGLYPTLTTDNEWVFNQRSADGEVVIVGQNKLDKENNESVKFQIFPAAFIGSDKLPVNYNVLGWADEMNGEVKYQDGDYVTLTKPNFVKDIYVVLEQKEVKFELTLDANGGTLNGEATMTATEKMGETTTTHVFNPAAPAAPEGYEFIGWKYEETVANTVTVTGETPAETVAVTAVAQYQALPEWTLDYDLMGVTTSNNFDVTEYHQSLKQKDAPTWTLTTAEPKANGLVFKGWSTTKGGKTAVKSFKAEDKAEVVYAIWEKGTTTGTGDSTIPGKNPMK